MVFLSATLPNALEFARWVAYNHASLCHVVYTEFRPTPLVHYAFPMGGNGLYLVRRSGHALPCRYFHAQVKRLVTIALCWCRDVLRLTIHPVPVGVCSWWTSREGFGVTTSPRCGRCLAPPPQTAGAPRQTRMRMLLQPSS
jgi:hypothetical protein